MKTLIVYYTRTNTTKIFARALAKELSADIEELKEDGNYSGPIGYMRAGRAAMQKKEVKLHEHRYDPANYDLVIIGSPVWAGLCAPAIRSYISEHKQFFRQSAIFVTQGSNKRQKALDDLKEQLNEEPISELFLPTKVVQQGDYQEQLKDFIK